MKYEDLPEFNSERWLDITPLKDEIWKKIEGWGGAYEISNYGRVKSCMRLVRQKNGRVRKYKEKIMRCFLTPLNYVRLSLEKNGIKRKFSVHQLVGKAFIDNPKRYKQINHKDENPQNNTVDNLEWCNAKYNLNYGTRIKRFIQTSTNNPKNSKPVLQYTFEGELIKEYPSIMETRRLYGNHVSEVCLHKCMSVYGYYWIYKGDDFNKWKAIHEQKFKKHKPWKIKKKI